MFRAILSVLKSSTIGDVADLFLGEAGGVGKKTGSVGIWVLNPGPGRLKGSVLIPGTGGKGLSVLMGCGLVGVRGEAVLWLGEVGRGGRGSCPLLLRGFLSGDSSTVLGSGSGLRV